jgi:hypothetical protein
MGYVMPALDIEYNPDIPKFKIDIDSSYPPFWHLDKH